MDGSAMHQSQMQDGGFTSLRIVCVTTMPKLKMKQVQRSAMRTLPSSANALPGTSSTDPRDNFDTKEVNDNENFNSDISEDKGDRNMKGTAVGGSSNGISYGSGWGCVVLVCNRSKNYQVYLQ